MKANQKRFQEALKRLDREVHTKASLGMYGNRPHASSSQRIIDQIDNKSKKKNAIQVQNRVKPLIDVNKTLQKVRTSTDLASPININQPKSPAFNKTAGAPRNFRTKLSNINAEPCSIQEFNPKPPNSPIDFNANSARSRRNAAKREGIEVYKVHNAQNLDAMLRIPKNAPLSARPKEVRPLLNWNDRRFLDYSAVEQELTKSAIQLHQLVTKNFENQTDDSNTLPIDFFDCYNNAPEEELKIRKIDQNGCSIKKIDNKGNVNDEEEKFEAHGSTKMRYDNEVEWDPCSILKFNPNSLTFTVSLDNKFSAFDPTKPLIKDVTRFNLRFDNEDIEKLDERYKLAEKLRSEYEQNLRTITFLDTIESNSNMTNFVTNDITCSLPDDAFNELLRAQKMQIIRGSLKLESDPKLEKLMSDLNININAYTPKPIKKPFLYQTNYSSSLNRLINNVTFISVPEFMKLRRGFHIACLSTIERTMKLYKQFFDNKLLTINEWEIKRNELFEEIRNYLFEFVDKLVSLINSNIENVLDDTNDDPDLKSMKDIKDRPFFQFFVQGDTLFNRVKTVLSVVLRQFSYDLLHENFIFFANLINYEFPEIHFEEISCDNFTTISNQPCDDSITHKPPLIKINLRTEKGEAKKIVTDLFNVINDSLKEMVDPFTVLFEKSDAKSVSTMQHSKFEPFLLANGLTNYVPAILHFNSEHSEIEDYSNELSELFKLSLDKHVNNSFTCLPEIQRNANIAMMFFTRDQFPPDEDAFKTLTKLDEQRMFFLKNFPPFVNIGIFCVSLSAFINDIDEGCQQYRQNVCQTISNKLVQLMNELHRDYTNLVTKLKQPVQTAENWTTLQDTLDTVLTARNKLELVAEQIKFLYDLLFSLYFGLESKILVRYLNTMMWPILIDMQLGQAVGQAMIAQKNYLKQNQVTLQQLQTEVNKLEESINSEKNQDSLLKLKNYNNHLQERMVRISEINTRMKITKYDKFNTPRVRLWCLVTLVQTSISDWQEAKISELDINSIKTSIDGYLKELRSLTKSFRGDTNSLRLLISTKNDLEQIEPLFKACSQILALYPKEKIRAEIGSMVGRSDYPNMSLLELKTNGKFGQIVPEIQTIYQRSKAEDKTDVDLINSEKTIQQIKVTFKSQNSKIIRNIDSLLITLREQKNILTNIQSIDDLPIQKRNATRKLISASKNMIEVLELFSSIQDIFTILLPLKKVSSMKEQSKAITEINKNYNKQIKVLQKDPVLISYATKPMNISTLKSIRTELKETHQKIIELVSNMRGENPRLLLVPDSKIISVFADEISLKKIFLSLIFPGVKDWVISDASELTGVTLNSDDMLSLTQPVSMKDPIFTLIPKLEDVFINSMKYAFFNEKEQFENLPIQLCFLKLIQDPTIQPDPAKTPKLKFTAIELFKKSILESTKKIRIEVIHKSTEEPATTQKEEEEATHENEEDKNENKNNSNPEAAKNIVKKNSTVNRFSDSTIYLIAGEGKIEYGFQFATPHSTFFSPSLYEIIYDIISLHIPQHARIPLLIHSQSYSISTIAIQQFSFLVGHPCFNIHPTLTTPISRLPSLIRSLDELHINVCIDEVEIFSSKQLFEIAMLIKEKFYCSLTTNSVSSIIQCGKIQYFLQLVLIQSHLEFIAPVFYPDQQKQIEFVTNTLTKYLHIEMAKNYLEKSYINGNEKFDLNFATNIRMVIPHEVFELALPDIIDSSNSNTQKNLNQLNQQVILSTQDFVSGVELIADQFKQRTRVMMVAGPPFSGITTCIMTAAQSANLPIVSLAFSSPNWIRSIIEALENNDNKSLVLHILLPFDHLFSAHSSSILLEGLICEGMNSLLTINSNVFVVFEMMTSITNAISIPIPIFTFSTPLVKSSELLLYWIVNGDFVMNYNDREFIRSTVSQIIDNSHQLSIFYTLFSTLLSVFPHFNKDSLSFMIGYCIFWSKVSEFTTIDEWNSYSDVVKSSIQQFDTLAMHIYEYMYNESNLSDHNNDMFELEGVYKNAKCISFDNSYMKKFSEIHCNRISVTNIPTQQFISCYQQLPLLLHNNKSVMIIGSQGSGKSTITKFITTRFLKEPTYITLNFDGETTTEDELLNQLISISVITVDGIIMPKDNCICVITIDPFSAESSIYGSVLSIAKTGNCIINKKILLFKNFLFIFVVEEYNYQLSTCCYPISIKPYDDQDFSFIAKEEITRILLKRSFSTPQITYLLNSLQPFLPVISKIINTDNKLRYLHFFFKIIRSVENIASTQTISLSDFFRWKMLQILPSSYSLNPLLNPPDNTLIEYELSAVNNEAKSKEKSAGINKSSNEDDKEYVYSTLNKQQSQFEEAILPFSHLYMTDIDINKFSLNYLSFVFDVIMSINTHAMVIDDLNQDYEMLTQFAASIISAKFIVYQSSKQLPSIIRESILSPQPIILFCREPSEELLTFISSGFKTFDVPKISGNFSDDVMVERMEQARNGGCVFPYSNLGNQPTYIDDISNKQNSQESNIKLKPKEDSTSEEKVDESLVLSKKSFNSSSTEVIDNDQAFTPSLSKNQAIVHRMRASDFSFFQLHSFRTVHVFFKLTTVDEIVDERKRNLFNLWDHSDRIPDTSKSPNSIITIKDKDKNKDKEKDKQNPLLQQLFSLMLRYKDKSYVKMIHQLSKVIKRYNYIIDRVNKYIMQRRLFVQQILVVINAIETSINDTSELIISTKKQIEMDEAFLQTHTQAVEYRQTIVTDLSGELARNKAELDQINAKDAEYNAYKSRDSANTSALVDQATKQVVKSFSQEEQYKLYIQQNPSQAVRHLFNTYCVLREFTPREDNDYWPEARVLLKSGRFHRTITVFDKNNIKKNVILQFDVMMNNPLIKEDNFPPNSACRALASWIHAVHKHTQSTSFNSTVSQEMLELQKSKARKEKEVEEIEKRLKTANEDLAKHEKSLLELKEKIKQENLLLANIIHYHETAVQVSKCFDFVKDELNKFNDGEKSKGANINGFALLEVCKSVVYPLFPKEFVPTIERQVDDLISDLGIESSYFVTLKEILGNDDPIVLSILSGDRLIAVFDPNDTTYDLLKSDPTIPALAKYDFLFTDPIESKTPSRQIPSNNNNNNMIQYFENYDLSKDGTVKYDSDNKEYAFYSSGFIEDFITAAERGKILVIHHADSVLNNPFLNSIVSQAVKSSIFKDRVVKINSDFRVIFLLDKPPSLYGNNDLGMKVPSRLNPHVTFISCNEIVMEKLESILLNDETPLKMEQKKVNADLMLQAQKENLYLALQDLHTQLQRIHASDTEVLKDVSLQSQLLQNSIQASNDATFLNDHVIDGFPWVKPLSLKISDFMEKLHRLYITSPLYIWHFSKFQENILNAQRQINLKSSTKDKENNPENDEKCNLLLQHLYKTASATMLKSHLWEVTELKTFLDQKIDFNNIFDSNNENNRLFMLHYTDIALAADFFIGKRFGSEDKSTFVYDESKHDDENFSVERNTDSEFIKTNVLPILLDDKQPKDVIITFFEENINVANMIDKIIFENPPSNWNKETRIFILVDNSFEMPTHLILSFKLFALE